MTTKLIRTNDGGPYPILVVGDLHLKVSNLETAQAFFDTLKNQCRKNQVHTLVFLGDVYDSKSIIHAMVQNLFMKSLLSLTREIRGDVYIIVGNHDFATSDLKNHSLEALEFIEKVHVVSRPTLVEGEALLVPYDCPENINLLLSEEGAGKIVMGHFGFTGDDFGNGIIEENGVSKASVKKCNSLCLGHFHKPNGYYIGSPWSHSFGEANQKKRLQLIESQKGGKFIPITDLPQHIQLSFSDLCGLNEAPFEVGDYVRITDVPQDELETLKQNYQNYPNMEYIVSVPETPLARIGDDLSPEKMVAQYIQEIYPKEKLDKIDDMDKLVKLAFDLMRI